MGRKKKKKSKKKKEEEDIEDDESQFSLNISGEVKRSIVAIFLFALAIIFILGFLGDAGMLGKSIDKTVGSAFGLGKWLSPIVLIIVGVILLFRKETLFYVAKIIGIVVAFSSILGFFHLYLDSEKLLEIAKSGGGGGYVGYAISVGLIKFTGTVAGSVILLATLLIGIIIAFDFSIVSVFQKIPLLGKKDQEGGSKDEDDKDDEDETEEIEALDEPEDDGDDEEGKNNPDDEKNIKNVEFIEGPLEDDQEDKEKESFRSKAMGFFNKEKTEEKFPSRPLDHSWELPPLDLLESSNETAKGGDVDRNAKIIKDTLGHFGIEVELGDIKTGPTVTQYSFRPAVGVKVSRITSLSNDLALALAAHPIRIEAPIPGKSLIGIEVPNKVTATVRMKDLLQSKEFKRRKSNLSLALGEDVSGNYTFGNLEKMPHLMIAGTTGAGKSVSINSILVSLFYQNSPEDLKLILVDPKRVELSLYNGIPYLLSDVIVENGKVVGALKWAIGEMEKRYRLLQDTKARDIASYNHKVKEGKKRTFIDPETEEEKTEDLQKLPFIVIVIDELADLMQAHGKEVEGAIIRLAQMARAVGIHLIVSTQRPSVEVLTGLIKANIATRIAFQVATQIDSRTILDSSGAEKLVGDGDMLYRAANSARPSRLQGVFVSEQEVKKVVKFIKNQKIEKIEEEIGEDITNSSPGENTGTIDLDSMSGADQDDSMYEEAKDLVIKTGKASASLLQRRLRVGYARAARLIDMLEENSIVGPANGAKPREILIGKSEADKPEYDDLGNDQEARDKWQM